MNSSRRKFLQQLGLGVGAFAFFSPGQRAAIAAASAALPRSTPEAEGISSAAILAFLEASAQSTNELHSFMMARHGSVISEGWWAPYSAELRHTMYSMSKSFTSTAVGFAVAEGKLRVNDRVVSYFPKDLPDQVSDNLAALRVKDLLTMSVGNEKEPTGTVIKEENWVRTFLAQPITHTPGSTFLYNSVATYMCSAIVQHLVGEKIVDYLRPRLFEPLGIEGVSWETCPRGINTGGWGLGIQTEGLAKFGQLYLQKGQWHGRQLLPEAWVEEATTFKIQQPEPVKPTRPKEQNDWLQGYCYQFWRCQHHGFRGDGAFGQYTIVLPEQDVVIAMTSEGKDMQGQLDLVWEHLLPAMKDAPLPADPATQTRLNEKLSSLALAIPKGQRTSPTSDRISGKVFQVEANEFGVESAAFAFEKDACKVTLRAGAAAHAITCGIERWERGTTALPGTPPRLIVGGIAPAGTAYPLVASGTWKDDNTFEMTWRFFETPHHLTITCKFDAETVQIAFVSSIGKMNGILKSDKPVLRGKLTA